MLRVRRAIPEQGFRVRLTLTDGSVVKRDLDHLLSGPVFEPLRRDPALFRDLRVEGGTIVWRNGADLCPDMLIWGGPPPEDEGDQLPAPTPI